MTTLPGGPPLPFPQPSVSGLSQITGSLYISSQAAASDERLLSRSHITSVVNVSTEAASALREGVQYLQVPVADAPTEPLCDFFDPIADHIHDVEARRGRTLLHCVAGVSRSAALGLAYLMKYHAMSLRDAHAWVRSCRPIIRPNSGFWEQLIRYELQLFGRNTVRMVSSPLGSVPDVYEEEVRLMIPL